MLKNVSKFLMILISVYYVSSCINADAENYTSTNVEISKNENTLSFYFRTTNLLAVTYQGKSMDNTVISFTPTFKQSYIEDNGTFHGACFKLCEDLESESLSSIIINATYYQRDNRIDLELEDIQIISRQSRSDSLSLTFEIETTTQPPMPVQKYLRVFNINIPPDMECIELLDKIKKTGVNFNSEGSHLSQDHSFYTISFSFNQNPPDNQINSELLFKMPFSKFITIDNNNDSTFVMITKRLNIDTQDENMILLDFLNRDKELLPNLSLSAHPNLFFQDYIKVLIGIAEHNVQNSPYFLAISGNNIFEFLHDDFTSYNRRIVTANLVEHKIRIQFERQENMNSFINRCRGIVTYEQYVPSPGTTLLLNEDSSLVNIEGMDNLKKIICNDVTYLFRTTAEPESYSFHREVITNTFSIIKDSLIDCPDFLNYDITNNFSTTKTDPSDDVRNLINGELRNFINVNVNTENKTINLLPKDFAIANPNPDYYTHLFAADDKITENKIKCSTFQKLNSKKDELLREWKKYLIHDYSIDANNDTIRIKFKCGYAKFILDSAYQRKRHFIKDFNNNFKNLFSPQNKILDDSSYFEWTGYTKRNYTNYILGPIQTEISTAQALTEYSFDLLNDYSDRATYLYKVTPKFDYYRIKFKFYKKLFREERKETIYPSNRRDMHIYLKDEALVIKNDPRNRNTYQLDSSEKIVNNQLAHLDQFFNMFNLPKSLRGLYSITYFNSAIDNQGHKTILGEFYLKDSMNKILIIYYPLQYSTSYRGSFPMGDRKDKYINSIDRKFRHFLVRLIEKNIYNKVFVRYSNSILLEANAHYENTIQYLFHEKQNYEDDNYYWDNNALLKDKLDIQNTSSVIDIIYLSSTGSKNRILQPFENYTSIRNIYYLNIVSPHIFNNKEIKIWEMPDEIRKIKPFLKVININYNNFEDTNYDIFSQNLSNILN